MSDKYRKGVIPKDDYMATIVHGEYQDNMFLYWCIDTGNHMWHTISQEIFISEFGVRQLNRMCQRMHITYYGSLLDTNEIFPLQFRSRRAKISVDIKPMGNYLRNIITYHQPAMAPPEINVTKPKTIDHFYAEKTKKQLPLQ